MSRLLRQGVGLQFCYSRGLEQPLANSELAKVGDFGV